MSQAYYHADQICCSTLAEEDDSNDTHMIPDQGSLGLAVTISERMKVMSKGSLLRARVRQKDRPPDTPSTLVARSVTVPVASRTHTRLHYS